MEGVHQYLDLRSLICRGVPACSFDSAVLHWHVQSLDDIILKAADFEFIELPKAVASKFEYSINLSPCDLFLSSPYQPITLEDSSDCMWTSLREALLYAVVSTLDDDQKKEIMKYSQEVLAKEGRSMGDQKSDFENEGRPSCRFCAYF
jgi:hypothetical protein